MRRDVRWCTLLLVALMACSCAGLTPAQRTLWALDVYENQYNMYLDAAIDPSLTASQRDVLKADPELIGPGFINPNLTESQKEILRVKKQILIELKPLVIMAGDYQITGKLPPDEVQRKMTELINRLVELVED